MSALQPARTKGPTMALLTSDRSHKIEITIDYRTGRVTADERHESDNGLPFWIYHGHGTRMTHPGSVLDTDELASLWTEEMAAAVVAGYTDWWDGNNTCGTLTDDARKIVDDFSDLLISEVENLAAGWASWEVADWLEPSMPRRGDPVIFNIDGEEGLLTRENVGRIAARLESEARSECILLQGDVERYLTHFLDSQEE